MKTVIKSRTMYMSMMPAGSRPPAQLLQSLKHQGAAVPESEVQLAQWIMVRERSLGRLRQKQSVAVPDDLDVSTGPMSPTSSRRLMLFFQVTVHRVREKCIPHILQKICKFQTECNKTRFA